MPLTILSVLFLAAQSLGAFNNAATAEKAQSRIANVAELSDADLDREIARFEKLIGAESSRARAHLFMERYRREAKSEIANLSPDLADERLAGLASLNHLFFTVNMLKKSGAADLLRETRLSSPVKNNLSPAIACLLDARDQSSILPGVNVPLARLQGILGVSGDDRSRREAVLLEPYGAEVVAEAGADFLESPAGNEIGLSFLRHAMGASYRSLGKRQRELHEDTINLLKIRERLAMALDKITPKTGEVAIEFAQSLKRYGCTEQSRLVLESTLRAHASPQTLQSCLLKARINKELGNDTGALGVLKQTALDYPGSAEAHFRLASMLAELGQFPEALKESRVAVGLDSTSAHYKTLLEDLTNQTQTRLNAAESVATENQRSNGSN
jgi:tetratricopeptide (TPR) repeat protein